MSISERPTTVVGDEQVPITSGRTDIAPLPAELCADRLFSKGQQIAVVGFLVLAVALVASRPLIGFGPAVSTIVQWLSLLATGLYVLHTAYHTVLTVAGWRKLTPLSRRDLSDDDLPNYSILVPLYQEEAVVPTLIESLSKLDYPIEKLQILLLVEESDKTTSDALSAQYLGPQFEILSIRPTMPRTKPKACNIGLRRVTGQLCTIYDAEDRPDPDQLRKAAEVFAAAPDEVVCLQAELHHWNPWTNWLTSSFAAEYALQYGPTLRGLDRLQMVIPLGGNSNHFRTEALCELGAWDSYNLTEDADLGVRIARRGWQVRYLPSATPEEANSQLGNWIRQRSRWVKGHMQTWLVHNRAPRRLYRELGLVRFLAFQVTFGVPIFSMLTAPIFWISAAASLVTEVVPATSIIPGPVLDAAFIGLLVATPLYAIQLVLGCLQRRLYWAIPLVVTRTIYNALITISAYKALIQLMRPSKRHYWELTRHGLVKEKE